VLNKTVFMTGGAGFIGSHLTERFCKDYTVVIYDNLKRNALANTNLLSNPNVKLVTGDVLERDHLFSYGYGRSHYIHMASIAGIDSVIEDPVRTMEVSLLGTRNLLSSLRHAKIERFINFSTSEVFGQYAYQAVESDSTNVGAVGIARWTYGVSKLAAEHLVYNYHKQYGMPTCSVRPFNVFGPNQIGEGAIHHFIEKAIRNEPIFVYNGGQQIRSWCYIKDFVDGVYRCMHDPAAIGQSFNIGNPKNTLTIYGLAKEIIRLSGSRSKILDQANSNVDVGLRTPDIAKATKLLGFYPVYDLEEGLSETIEWYREHLNA